MLALGLVETKGFLPAIEGADAMLKSADVRLLERNFVGGGLVTITIAGEVSAVKASVEAAEERIKRITGAELVSVHVIPRPDEELMRILKLEPDTLEPLHPTDPQGRSKEHAPEVQAVPLPVSPDRKPVTPVLPAVQESDPSIPTVEKSKGESKVEGEKTAPSQPALTEAKLRRMSLNRLRQTARTVEGLPMDEETIASADRKALIAVLLQAITK